MLGGRLFTSESVSEGHPDKIADQISDAILDSLISQDKNARVACETLVKTGLIVVAGEISTNAWVDVPTVARRVVKDIGYTDSSLGFDSESCGVISSLEQQSPDIAMGVNRGEDLGAGDQGIMFGYACDETPTFMPATIYYAHEILKQLSKLRKAGASFIRPDSKSQVTAKYNEKGEIEGFTTIVVSTQHSESISMKDLYDYVVEECVKKVVPASFLKNTKYLVNPTGRFVIGGPKGDCGLTGRKIIVDTYGGHGACGGGAFSGKDPTKVDRSASYMARYIAKNIVASGLASSCLVQLAYAIGVASPVGIWVTTNGTGKISDEKIAQIVEKNFSLTPKGIIEHLELLNPIYERTASYGHFGRDEFSWEKTDMKDLFIK